MICLSNSPVDEHGGCFQFLAITKMLLWMFVYNEHMLSFILGSGFSLWFSMHFSNDRECLTYLSSIYFFSQISVRIFWPFFKLGCLFYYWVLRSLYFFKFNLYESIKWILLYDNISSSQKHMAEKWEHRAREW